MLMLSAHVWPWLLTCGQNETVLVLRNQRSAGRVHWMIIPKQRPAVRHIRDIEALTSLDLPLCTYRLLSLPPALSLNHFHSIIIWLLVNTVATCVVKEMNKVKDELLETHFSAMPRSSVHCGYHRGRRYLIEPVILSDIVSIHHLHLHIIVEPKIALRIFKYPGWFLFMWKSDKKVMVKIARRKVPRIRVKK